MKITYIKFIGSQEVVAIPGDHIRKIENVIGAVSPSVINIKSSDDKVSLVCDSCEIVYAICIDQDEDSQEDDK
jgi:hypothetical protein